MFCTRCGQQNQPDARFCARCGTTLLRPGEPIADVDSDVSATSTLNLDSLTAGEHSIADSGADEGEQGQDVAQGLAPGTALLVVRRGPNAGSRFLLDRPVTAAGRHPDSDIFLDDVTVSRRHAEFRREDNSFFVRDVGSLNGTYVNRERIDVVELAGGDEVQVGKFRLVFLLGPTAADEEAGGEAGGEPAT